MVPFKLAISMSLTMLLIFGLIAGLFAIVLWYLDLSIIFAVLFGLIMIFIQWYFSPKIIEWSVNMRYISKEEYPKLWDTVKDLSKKMNIPMPKVAIVRSGAPNAFTFGRSKKDARVAVTTGLLKTLNEMELKAVIGHELTHIQNRDVIVLTIASALPVMAYYIAQVTIFRRYYESERRGSLGILIGIGAYFVYFISNLLVLFLSRLREYAADYGGAIATKPSLLASALAKITYGLSTSSEKVENSAVRSFFIADPISAATEVNKLASEYSDLSLDEKELEKAMEWERKNPLVKFLEIFRTHPLTFKRILALKELEKELGKS